MPALSSPLDLDDVVLLFVGNIQFLMGTASMAAFINI